MIIDCFPFFNEVDLLEIRLQEHNTIVDKFIIVEADKTHAGNSKPFNYEINKEKFKKFEDKIIYLKLFYDQYNLPATNLNLGFGSEEICKKDAFQKDFARLFLLQNNILKDNDVIIFSDLDEIIDSSKINDIIKNVNEHEIVKCMQKTCVFKFNLVLQDYDVTGFDGAKIGLWKYMKNINWMDLRLNRGKEQYKMKCGWHFTYLSKDSNNVLYKLKNYSHCNEFKNIKNSNDAISAVLKNVRINDIKSHIVKIDETFPKYLRENVSQFEKFIIKE